jgi:hypothetical protein
LFVVLDPYWFSMRQGGGTDNWSPTLGREQYEWLSETLETSQAEFKFIFVHQLVGGMGKDGRGGAEAAMYFEWGDYNLGGPGHVRVTVSPSQVTVEYVCAYLPQNENGQSLNGKAEYMYTIPGR